MKYSCALRSVVTGAFVSTQTCQGDCGKDGPIRKVVGKAGCSVSHWILSPWEELLLGASCVDAEHRRDAFSYVCSTPSASHTPEKDKWSWEKAPVGVPLTLPPYQVSSAAVKLPSNLWKVF